MCPLTMVAVGGAVAGGISSIMGGFGKSAEMKAQAKAQAEQVRVQNQQALNNWVQGNIQKAFNNGREQFNAANQWVQQMKRNEALSKSAYQYQWEAQQAAKTGLTFEQKQLSQRLRQQSSSLAAAVGARGIGTSAGMYQSMALAQAIDAVQTASVVDFNYTQQVKNINKEFEGIMSQRTENVFIGNMQQWDQMPVLSSAAGYNSSAGMWAIAGGLLSGGAQLAGAGAALGS